MASPTFGPARQLLNVAIAIAVAVGMIGIMAVWFRGQTTVFEGSILFVVTLCTTITGSAIVLLVVVMPLVHRWPRAAQWLVFLPTFASAGALGTWLAPAVLYAIGVLPSDAIRTVFAENFRGTIPSTIVVGTVLLAVEGYKARLRAAEAQLQTQRIDRERSERLLSEARLAALSARVQPHFLFNTLNAIAALVRENPHQAEQTVEQLSAVLRGSLDTAVLVPLAREMKLVDDYMRIQQVRFGGRLRFTVDWDAESVGAAMLPPFAVQALVENAIKHVAGERAEGVAIHVRARRTDACLLVDVSDDGSGFDEDAARAGHGLDTLRGRLRSMFGDDGRLELDRQPTSMTVRLSVPFVTTERLGADRGETT
jgi:hypothetical protein